MRLVNGCRLCMDYRKFNTSTYIDYFSMMFIDLMLERLEGNNWYNFLDDYLGYNKSYISLEDQENATFTCQYGTFVFKRMPFGPCNALTSFLHCMLLIFYDLVEDTIEVFMDNF